MQEERLGKKKKSSKMIKFDTFSFYLCRKDIKNRSVNEIQKQSNSNNLRIILNGDFTCINVFEDSFSKCNIFVKKIAWKKSYRNISKTKKLYFRSIKNVAKYFIWKEILQYNPDNFNRHLLLLSLFTPNQFIGCIIQGNFYFIYIQDQLFYLLSSGLTFIHKFQLNTIKSISLNGKHAVVIKFFNFEFMLNISFFSSQDRESLLNIILRVEANTQEINFCKFLRELTLIIIYDQPLILNNLLFCTRMKLLNDCNHFYQKYFYDTLATNTYSFNLIMLILTQTLSLQMLYKICFLDIKIIKYKRSLLELIYDDMILKTRKHNDSLYLNQRSKSLKKEKKLKLIVNTQMEIDLNLEDENEDEGDDEITFKAKNKKLSPSKTMVSDNKGSIEEEEDYFGEDLSIKQRPRNRGGVYQNRLQFLEKRSYTEFALKSPNLSIAESVLSIKKPIYDKIAFNITIPKMFGKEKKILQVKQNGEFSILTKNLKVCTLFLIILKKAR
jgi:hypothetical protein